MNDIGIFQPVVNINSLITKIKTEFNNSIDISFDIEPTRYNSTKYVGYINFGIHTSYYYEFIITDVLQNKQSESIYYYEFNILINENPITFSMYSRADNDIVLKRITNWIKSLLK